MYITIPLSPRNPQIPIDILWDLDGTYAERQFAPFYDPSATITRVFDNAPGRIYETWRPERLHYLLLGFNESFRDVINRRDYRSLYRHYEIPKKNGKMRPIDEPLPELRAAQDKLLEIFETCCPATHHAAAYAYVKQRETLDAVKKHQKNDSHWFAKFDFSNFFGSTTKNFVMHMLKQIYPFSVVCKMTGGEEVLESALSVCFLNGGLPQGSPISPMITNIMMIPIDHKLMNTLLSYDKKQFVYTRYADDIQVSCKYAFDVAKIERLINQTLREFWAPFQLNQEKTHYGSRAGRNWMLGIMLNADNNTTVGYKEKKFFKAMLTNYISDRRATVRKWELSEVQQLAGKLSYYRHIEKDYFDKVVAHLSEKFSVDIDAAIKDDIRNMTI